MNSGKRVKPKPITEIEHITFCHLLATAPAASNQLDGDRGLSASRAVQTRVSTSDRAAAGRGVALRRRRALGAARRLAPDAGVGAAARPVDRGRGARRGRARRVDGRRRDRVVAERDGLGRREVRRHHVRAVRHRGVHADGRRLHGRVRLHPDDVDELERGEALARVVVGDPHVLGHVPRRARGARERRRGRRRRRHGLRPARRRRDLVGRRRGLHLALRHERARRRERPEHRDVLGVVRRGLSGRAVLGRRVRVPARARARAPHDSARGRVPENRPRSPPSAAAAGTTTTSASRACAPSSGPTRSTSPRSSRRAPRSATR